MRISHRRAGPLVAFAALSLTLAACGGGTATDDPTETPLETPVATPTDAAPTPDPEATPTDAAVVLPSFDPADILANLEGIDSYRVVVTTDGEVSYSAVVVTKPELARDIQLGDSEDDERIVVIGDEAWMGSGDDLEPVPPAMSSAMLAAFDPFLIFAGFTQAAAWDGADDLGTESRNDVDTRHFRIDDTTAFGTIPQMPDGASIDIWIAEDGGYLIALEIVGEDGDDGFIVDITDINDPSITVERPD